MSFDLRITNILVARGILSDNEAELYRHLCQRVIPAENLNIPRMNYSSRYSFVESAYSQYLTSMYLRTEEHDLELSSKVKFKLENILFFEEEFLKKILHTVFRSVDREWMLPILSLKREGEYLALNYLDGDTVTEWNYSKGFILDGLTIKGKVKDDNDEFRMKARKLLLNKLSNGDEHIKIRYQALAYLLTRNIATYPYDTLNPTRKEIVSVMFTKKLIPMLYPPKMLPKYLLVANKVELDIPILTQRYFYCTGRNGTVTGIHSDTSRVLLPYFEVSLLNEELLNINRIGFVNISSVPREKCNLVFENGRNLRFTQGLIIRCDNTYFPFDLMYRNAPIPRHFQLVRVDNNTIVPFRKNRFFYCDEKGDFEGTSFTCKYQGIIPWEFRQKNNVKFSSIKSLMAVVYFIENNVGVYVQRNGRYERIGYKLVNLNKLNLERFRIVDSGEDKHEVYDNRIHQEYLEPDSNGIVFLLNGKYVTQEHFDNFYLQVPGMIEPRLFALDSLNEKYGKFIQSMIDVGFLMPHILRLNQERL